MRKVDAVDGFAIAQEIDRLELVLAGLQAVVVVGQNVQGYKYLTVDALKVINDDLDSVALKNLITKSELKVGLKIADLQRDLDAL